MLQTSTYALFSASSVVDLGADHGHRFPAASLQPMVALITETLLSSHATDLIRTALWRNYCVITVQQCNYWNHTTIINFHLLHILVKMVL